jgi:hypothetical protein
MGVNELTILANWAESIILNITATVLMSSVVILTPKLRKRIVKRLFSRKNKTRYDIVCTSIEYQNTPFHGCRPVTAYGELLALAELYSTLNHLGGVDQYIDTVRMSTEDNFSNDRLTNNIISIGGSTYNRVTKLIKDECSRNWAIIPHDKHDEIIDGDYFYHEKQSGTKHKAGKNSNNIITLDYGLVTKCPNPFNRDSKVVILDGLHTYGLIGAAKVIGPKYIYRHIRSFNFFRDDYFQILVRCKVVGLEVFVSNIRYFKLDAPFYDQSR